MKKWYQKLSHPWAKSTAGFTLVELVVVIAILGVLAGVGTVGYSGYIKNAQKNADKTLVGNIVRAIEVGTNSTMFVPPESLAVSATTYPIGFIVLDDEGGKTLTSSTKRVDVNAECVFSGGEPFYYLKKVTKAVEGCNQGKTKDVYELVEMKTNYCVTHSHDKAVAATTDYAQKYVCSKEEEAGGCGGGIDCTISAVNHDLSGKLVTTSTEKLYTAASGGKCQLAANVGLASNDYSAVSPPTIMEDNSVLSESIKAAFGDNANLALQYDKWGEDDEDEVGYTTLYGSASEMFTEVDTMAQLLVDLQGLKNIPGMGSKFDGYFTGSYADSGDLVISFSEFMTKNNITASKWDGYWAKASANNVNDEYGFGINADGNGGKNDYIWAARLAYNSSFASYCKAHGVSSTYTDVITDYGQNAYSEISNKAGSTLSGAVNGFLNATVPEHKETNIPSVANTYAFDKTKTTQLYDQFVAAGDDGTAFDQCAKLYEKYKVSDACKRNGQEFYKTMTTIADTGAYAKDANNGYDGNYLNYYKSYLDEMAGLYDKALQESEGGIMIIVTMENGVTKCQVSPSSADPRNSN